MSSNTFSRIEQFALLFIFLVFFFTIGSWWNVYQLDADEGINLQKAALLANGHNLYTEIWSDQPPFFTYILSIVHNIFPFSVSAARGTVLLFSAILMISLFRVINRFEGHIAAWAAALILISGKLYLTLSVSVLIGLPAIALSVLTLDILTAESVYSRRVQAIVAGIVFAFAVTTKFFVLLVLPSILIAAAYVTEKDKVGFRFRTKAKFIALFTGSLCLTIFMIFLAVGGFNVSQLLDPHVSASKIDAFAGLGSIIKSLVQRLQGGSTAAFYLGVTGVLLILIKKNWSRLIPVVWLVIGVLVFSMHRPLWGHHLLLVVIPLSWLGGIATVNMFRCVTYVSAHIRVHSKDIHKHRFFAIFFFLLFLIFLTKLSGRNILESNRRFSIEPSITDQLVQSRLGLFITDSKYIVADKPIDAFRVGKLVPPGLAVWSSKRRRTGNITNEEVLGIIDAFDASQIILRRFSYKDEFLDEISEKNIQVGLASVSGRRNRFFHYIPRDRILNSHSSAIHDSDLKASIPQEIDSRILMRNVLMKLSLLGANGIGGLYDSRNSQRYDRIQSKHPLQPYTIVSRPPGSAQEIGA